MRIEHTDGYQLRKFADAMRPHVQLRGAELQAKVKEHGQPVITQLLRNGHELADAIDLLRRTLADLTRLH